MNSWNPYLLSFTEPYAKLEHMIDSADYTPDGKFLVMKQYGQEEPMKVPVALIDELIERGLSSYDLARLLLVRKQTAGQVTSKVPMEELAKEDLTGKTVGIYFRNYEDSEWMSTDKAIGVKQDEGNTDYRFVFPTEYEQCWDGECSHHNEDTAEDDECFRDELQGIYFWGRETVLVKEKELINV
jgi:hypothetical protein